MGEIKEVEKKLIEVRERITKWEKVIRYNRMSKDKADFILDPFKVVEFDLKEQLYLLDAIEAYDMDEARKLRDKENADKVKKIGITLSNIEFRISHLENKLSELGIDRTE